MRKWLYNIFLTVCFTCLIIYAVYLLDEDEISSTSNQQITEDYSQINLQPAIYLEIVKTPNIEIILNSEQKVISFQNRDKDEPILFNELNIFYQPLDIALATIYNNYYVNEEQPLIYIHFNSTLIDYKDSDEEQIFTELQESIKKVYGDKVLIQKISNVIIQEENQYNINDNSSNGSYSNSNNSDDNTPIIPITPVSPLVPKIDRIPEVPSVLDIPQVPNVYEMPNAKTPALQKGM